MAVAHDFKRGKKLSFEDITNTEFSELYTSPTIVFSLNGESLVAVGDSVRIGTPLMRGTDGFTLVSSVSGRVGSVSDSEIVIENDLQMQYDPSVEPYGKRTGKTVSELDFDEFIAVLNACSVKERGEGALGAFLERAKGSVTTLVMNAVVTESSDVAPLAILENHTAHLVLAMKLVMAVMGIKKGIVALAGRSRHTLRVLEDFEGANDFIKVVRLSDNYPQQNKNLLMYSLSGKELSPLQNSFASGYLVLSPKTLLDIYEAFAVGMSSQKAMFTLVCADRSTALVSAPAGTPIEYIKEKYSLTGSLCIGSPLEMNILPDGACIESDTARICELEQRDEIGVVCNKCGECIDVCPMYLYPYEFATAGKKRAVDSGINVCIGCGLCTAICPSGVPLHKKIASLREICKEE